MDKLRDMTSLRSYILESQFIPPAMAKALFGVLPLVEATNINKDFLLKTAGSPEALAKAKQSVNTAWAADEMDGIVRNQNVRQKVLNILYLMEIRKPGFTNHEILKGIHDLAIANSLEQRFLSKVNSDTLPDEAAETLMSETQAAVQAAKVYPDLTDEEEKVWNRVKLYHEFPDGFKWIYAVDANGRIAPNMPSNITHKTMNHCGNSPRAGSDDQYWELRGPDGKAYLTVILNPAGEIQESKSWGNQVNKYRKQILPYVKWFLMDRKVTGVGGPHDRYSGGYSAHTNFGVKDFIGDDNEFVDYVMENKPALLGTTEKRTLFWKTAIQEGIITVDDIKKLYADGCTLSDLADRIPALKEYTKTAKYRVWDPDENGRVDESLFGMNSFEVVCAACDGCPFSKEELLELIREDKISLPEFANYDIKLLTPDIQKAFVEVGRGYRDNLGILMEIAAQVATFEVAEDAILGLITGSRKQWDKFFTYLSTANPPSKVSDLAHRVFADKELMTEFRNTSHSDNGLVLCKLIDTISRFDDIPITDWMPEMMAAFLLHASDRFDDDILDSLEKLDTPRVTKLLSQVPEQTVYNIFKSIKNSFEKLNKMVKLSLRCGWGDLLEDINNRVDNLPEFDIAYTTNTGKNKDRCIDVVSRALTLGNELQDNESKTWWRHDYICSLPSLAHALVVFPEILDSLDWLHSVPATKAIKDALTYGRITDVPDHAVDSFLTKLVGYGTELLVNSETPVEDSIAEEWACGQFDNLLDSIISLGERFGLDAGKYSKALSDILLGWIRIRIASNAKSVEYDIPDLHGQGTWVYYPMEQWQELAEQYGGRFTVGYIMRGGMGRGLPTETTWPALIDLLAKLPTNEQDIILSEIVSSLWQTGIRSLVKELTEHLANGTLTLTVTQLTALMKRQIIPAKLIRQLIDSGQSDGIVEVTSAEGIAGLANSLHKMLKVTSLPDIIMSAMRSTVNFLYDHLGVAKGRWGIEWAADSEPYARYMAQLLNKLTGRLDKYYPAQAYLTLLSDTTLIKRIEDFIDINRAEESKVDRNQRPVWSCQAEREVSEIIGMLERPYNRELAEKTVNEKSPKTKGRRAPRSRKSKGSLPEI